MKIALVGDVMLGRLVNQMLKQRDSAFPWGNTLPILQQADLRICNLECVLSDVGSPWSATPKMFHFRSDEKNVRTLQEAKIDVVSLANNHVLDYEDEALLRMLAVLDREKILHAGAGRNIQQASEPVFCQVEGQKICMVAFTDNEPDWEAQTQRPGVFHVPPNLHDQRAKGLLERIRQLREAADFIIISAHWGSNWGYEPPEEHKVFAHAMINAGADLIFGHSGHVFRGIEVYKNRPIIYCAGDFIDDYAVDEIEKNDESFIYVLEKEEKGLKLLLYPSCIGNFRANLTVSRREEILSKMEALCKQLGTHMQLFPTHAEIEV